ncbi:inactive serine/threonine-protein kinase PLK5 isoform X3 [Erinaceus europaeus]|uniref:Inactive serine/threonine-protein kinase PLK5 isoform X3 n=1 Tax=Erinaceus europaeus TaxID=9365 RepID=A0ABM3WLP2_ERIEU|nr:inactive serine/threonine-protein kinase PLK5 isoform X3 [Erinaceus europaeus]
MLPRCCAVLSVVRPARRPAGGMERGRRARPHRGLVSAFLRDPGSGRVYRRGRLIGEGAFSRCYQLTDMSSSVVFALKVVPRRAGWLRLCGKVEREIALHSRLHHRNLVSFHGHFADRDHVYMVLEYCSRQSLAHVLEVRRMLTEPEVRYYLRGLASGLQYLHQQRIVHRDLKLSGYRGAGGRPQTAPFPLGNFFLNENMEVKIGDLGLATKVGPGGRCHRVVCGTPNFLAPEVVAREGHSCQSDIWVLGCVMYLVLTGSPPFGMAPLAEVFENIREGRYPEPAHLSPQARRLISRLLAPDPAARPSLNLMLQDNFFTQGFTPERLPAHSCHCPPIFATPPGLGHLLRKVRRLLGTPSPRPGLCPPSKTPRPEEDSPSPESMELAVQPCRSPQGGSRISGHAGKGTTQAKMAPATSTTIGTAGCSSQTAPTGHCAPQGVLLVRPAPPAPVRGGGCSRGPVCHAE